MSTTRLDLNISNRSCFLFIVYLRKDLSNEANHTESAKDDSDERKNDDERIFVVNQGV
jgi:hypothetical protein